MATLQIKTENGVCYLDLSAGDDGPTPLPLEKERFPAMLISTRHEGDQVIVTLAKERAELEVEPLGRYELRIGETAKVELPGSKAQNGQDWELRLVRPANKAIPGCCSCTFLKINCCPFPGKCLGCGNCGNCCG